VHAELSEVHGCLGPEEAHFQEHLVSGLTRHKI